MIPHSAYFCVLIFANAHGKSSTFICGHLWFNSQCLFTSVGLISTRFLVHLVNLVKSYQERNHENRRHWWRIHLHA